jgi:threonylcarbamoyladenosine tRNA methylthiotransferase MtaB
VGLKASGENSADVVVVNTCSVTAEADRAARAFIRRTHRRNPEAKIVVTGCYAQRAPGELASMAGVAAVVGNSHKALTPEIILGLTEGVDSRAGLQNPELVGPRLVTLGSVLSGGAQIWADELFAHSFLEEAQLTPGAQTRPNLKIQEGCGNRCTFCVIPQTRGSSRSLAAESVLRQVEGFVEAGGQELVLSGINLGRWGRDFDHEQPQWRLAGLVRTIFERTTLARLRLSSIEPMDWDAELIGLMKEFGNPVEGAQRLARHAHLPLQSGSDGVLRRMHRRYRPWHYAEKVAALVAAAGAGLTLGADVMVGFPGETDREFEETVQLIESLPYGYLHLFPFSARPATRAWELHRENPVATAVVDERMNVLRALAAEKSTAHRRRFVAKELEAITLHTPTELATQGGTAALTENFLPVEMAGRMEANCLVRVRVSGVTAEGALKATAMPQPSR